MSEVVSMINNMKAPGSKPREKPRRKKFRALMFDGVLQYAELIEGLKSAGIEILPRTALTSSTAAATPDLILAEIHELDLQDRRAVESLRHAHPQILAIGIGSPVVVALSKGRRRRKNYPERRRAAPNRRIFDEFVSTPVDLPALLNLIQAWRARSREKTAHRRDPG